MFCKSGILIFIFAENNYIVRQYICPPLLIKTPLLHQSFDPHVFSLSLPLSLSLFQANSLVCRSLWIHFPSWASKTLSRSAPSPHWEGTWGLHEQSKPRVRDFIGFLRKPRNIRLLLLYFLIVNSRPPGSLKDLNSVWLLVTPWTAAHQAPPSVGFSRQKYWSGLPLSSL